jgi:hypothetical protein
MKAALTIFAVAIVYLESVSPGSGLGLLQVAAWVVGLAVQSPYVGAFIGLALIIPAFMAGADWRAKAMLEEERRKLQERERKWRVF